jgi:tetratricopeptide (TPR) repeat protein
MDLAACPRWQLFIFNMGFCENLKSHRLGSQQGICLLFPVTCNLFPITYVLSLLIGVVPALAMKPNAAPCGPEPAVRAQLEKAAAAPIGDVKDFDRNIAPFLELRKSNPENLFVHERYQDAVRQHGIEGHLKAMAEEYQDLMIRHPGELTYLYLSARALIGRTTPAAIQSLNEIVTDNPNFAPAHRALAEIYALPRFRDAEKENEERKKLMSLCPGTVLAQGPGTLLAPSPLLDQAERLLQNGGGPDRAMEMAAQALRDDEWRLQRIRPFDWYTVEFKRESERQVRVEYVRQWALQVRAYRQKNQPEQAAELLAKMERSTQAISRDPLGPAYWNSLLTLARLYAEANQPQDADAKLEQMKQFLAAHPDQARTAQLEQLRKAIRPQ